MSPWNMLRRYGDAALAAGCAIGVGVELARYPGRVSLLAVPVGVLGALALAARQRLPVPSFAVIFASNVAIGEYLAPRFQAHSVFVVLVFLVGLYSIGAHAVGVEAWWGVGFLLASVGALDLQDGDNSAAGIFFFLVMCGLPWAAGVIVRLRVERVAELNARNAELQEQARRAVVDERARLARELHDVVSHAIAVTVLQARGGARLVGRDDEAVRHALRAIERTNTAALADMRRLLGLLRTAGDPGARDEPAPNLEQLPALIDRVGGSGLPVEFEVTGDPLPMPPGVELSAYRIVQEALTNVLKHAGAGATAQVRIAYRADDLEVDVTNTGQVPSPSSQVGHGLIGIRERVGMTGGTVDVGPTADGYAVRARLPYLLGDSLASA